MKENYEPTEIAETRSGNFAKVQMLPTEVIVEPKSILPTAVADINQKMENQQVFNEMFSNFDGINICPIKEKDTTKGRYVVERAQGVNLSNTEGERDGDIEDFLSLSIDAKTKGVLIYLRMIKELNSKEYSFQDHKGDSIFIQKVPENRSSCTLSLIDAGSITRNNSEDESWESELRGGLKDTLKSFFTRGNNMREIEGLIPTGLKTILDRIDTYPNADSLLSEVRAYVKGGKVINSFDFNERKSQMLTEFNRLKDTSLKNALENRDFSQLSQYEIERFETLVKTQYILENTPLMNMLKR
ncbi:MAG: hypothetical protein RBS01_01565 [Candidatus Dojkabacteria bacterium]|jgi:hypothetical protein|nr:hypothetical protein [Candidatus Dojkabacteria bacterium]